MKEKLPEIPKRKKGETEKGYWERVLKEQGLGDLTSEFEDGDATPKDVASAYANLRHDDIGLAKKMAQDLFDEGQHDRVAHAIADRFGISFVEARRIVDDALAELNEATESGVTDLWSRFKNRR